ncbi:ISAzo13-like element transposase-related protein [Cupriavidus sp. BIC8F]|uniref:ISAzo13-like element transposase-related protein n=1 Tax=Cupriavidus sp. BIC8F TaxID=3079014 RepID=UPI00396760D3
MREHTAGNPQHGVIWTDLKPREIAQAMTQQVDGRVSVRTVRQLLKRNGFSRRQSQKLNFRHSGPLNERVGNGFKKSKNA